jgi:pimeloyl-ACP methyl ester carboxylesterase
MPGRKKAQAAGPAPTPIIVVHGNPASNLLDLYTTTPEGAYTLSRGGWPLHKPSFEKRFDRLPFHPDDQSTTLNTTGKAVVPARMRAITAFYLPYEDLVEQLKKDVGWQDQPAPVFPFAYDWRFDTAVSAVALDDFVSEVLRIASRLPEYKKKPPARVDIVAHSFGGLVTARYLAWCQRKTPRRPARVRKVVTIASPFQGSVDALHAMIKDLDQRETARTLPSVWGLLPWFDGAVVDETTKKPQPPAVNLLTHPTIWKGSSVERSLDAYCQRMRSAKKGAARLQELRAAARVQAADLRALDVGSALRSADDWLPIVGTGSQTNVGARVVGRKKGTKPNPEFQFDQGNQGEATGDNTVPFRGAVPPFNLATGAAGSPTPHQRLVCFTEDDIGLHERGDWFGLGQMLGLSSLHSFLPRMDDVQQLIIGFLREKPPQFKARAHPAPGVKAQDVDWPKSWNVDAV